MGTWYAPSRPLLVDGFGSLVLTSEVGAGAGANIPGVSSMKLLKNGMKYI